MVKSARGKEINLAALIAQSGDTIALGNANVNARGDLIKNGKVVKTREELAREYHKNVPNAVKNVPMSMEISKMFEEPKKKVAPKPFEAKKKKVEDTPPQVTPTAE